jgi:hypothetical protein
MMELARAERKETIRALARLRDQTEAPHIALQAARLLLQYADGDPGPANVPPPPEPGSSAGDMDDVSPPDLSPELVATLERTPDGGDAGGTSDGNGGTT